MVAGWRHLGSRETRHPGLEMRSRRNGGGGAQRALEVGTRTFPGAFAVDRVVRAQHRLSVGCGHTLSEGITGELVCPVRSDVCYPRRQRSPFAARAPDRRTRADAGTSLCGDERLQGASGPIR